MKLVIASDHGGFELKENIKKHLLEGGHDVLDMGTASEDSVSYAKYSQLAAEKIVDGTCERGIVICGTGIGVSIVANKNPGVRCALCTNAYMAQMARRHNDANVLALGGRVLAAPYAIILVDIFVSEPYDDGRHQQRIDEIADFERKNYCD